jgi:hypothetical protein
MGTTPPGFLLRLDLAKNRHPSGFSKKRKDFTLMFVADCIKE